MHLKIQHIIAVCSERYRVLYVRQHHGLSDAPPATYAASQLFEREQEMSELMYNISHKDHKQMLTDLGNW